MRQFENLKMRTKNQEPRAKSVERLFIPLFEGAGGGLFSRLRAYSVMLTQEASKLCGRIRCFLRQHDKRTSGCCHSERSLRVVFGITLLVLSVNITAQQFNWVRSIGGSTAMSGNTIFDYVEDATIDKWGNAYVAGRISANPKVNGVSISPGGYGAEDGYLAKFDRCGNLEWMHIIGKNLGDFTAGVAVDDVGNVYVTGRAPMGQFYSPCKDSLFPVNSAVTFVTKYDRTGCMKWLKGMNGFSAFPLSRNIKMGSDGKLYVWMRCQWHADPVVDNIKIDYITNMFMRMDTNGVIEHHKLIDSMPPELVKFVMDEDDNLYLYYYTTSSGSGSYKIGNTTVQAPQDCYLTVKLDKDFNSLTHRVNYRASLWANKIKDGKMYSFGRVRVGASYHGDTTHAIHSRQSVYADKVYISDLDLNALQSSQPDTQRVQAIKCEDLALLGNHLYFVIPNSGFMKWSDIDMLNFDLFAPDFNVLVRFSKDNLIGTIVDTIKGFGITYFEDYVRVMETDRQGNIYMAGQYAGYLTLGETVTPNGGGASPDGFLARWGLPCTDTTDALIAPERPLSLTATAATQQINVQWQDAAQYELGYELYRSIGDTLQWVKTDSLPRNTQNKTDGSVQQNIVYWYKVRAFNSGGFSAWSNADSAMITKEDTTVVIGIEEVKTIKYLEIYPNPANDKVTAGIYTENAANGSIRLLSLEGREYARRAMQLGGGMQRETIDISGLSAGIYLIEVQAGNSRMVQRLVVMKR